jgi:LDH2 family malate/lactate/ureidoglycolate dehydrogenase
MEPSDHPVGKGLGHFLGAMRVDGFRPLDEFKSHLDNWIERFSSAKRISEDQKVIIPGEPELIAETERRISGIPIIDEVYRDLNDLADKLGISRLN